MLMILLEILMNDGIDVQPTMVNVNDCHDDTRQEKGQFDHC